MVSFIMQFKYSLLRKEWLNLSTKLNVKKVCVTLINFLPLIKRVSQFLIKGELFLEREGRERERFQAILVSFQAGLVYLISLLESILLKCFPLLNHCPYCLPCTSYLVPRNNSKSGGHA